MGLALYKNAKMASELQTDFRGSSPISTFVFLDLETTGFLNQPNCRITELCMIAVHRNDLTKDLPRVMNKLTICLNPKKKISGGAERVSGLSNNMLKSQKSFKGDTVQLISMFLRHLSKPVCFLAHNGKEFDFPLILGEIKRCNQSLYDGLLCADTLEVFKVLETSRKRLPVAGESCDILLLNKPQKSSSELKEVTTVLGKRKSTSSFEEDTKKPRHSLEHVSATASTSQNRGYDYAQHSTLRGTPLTRQGVYQSTSNKLQDIYCRHFDEKHPNAHSAEGDCIAMLKIAGWYPEFADWVDQNAVRLSSILPANI